MKLKFAVRQTIPSALPTAEELPDEALHGGEHLGGAAAGGTGLGHRQAVPQQPQAARVAAVPANKQLKTV